MSVVLGEGGHGEHRPKEGCLYKATGGEGPAEGRCTSFRLSSSPHLKGQLNFSAWSTRASPCPAGSQFSMAPSHPTLWPLPQLR